VLKEIFIIVVAIVLGGISAFWEVLHPGLFLSHGERRWHWAVQYCTG
jgi:hypothetical protein